jgi:hypothetical protein
MIKIAHLVLVFCLLGCATKFPEGVSTAMIRFTAQVPTIVQPMCERDRFIEQGIILNSYFKQKSPVSMYGTRAEKTNEVAERLIPADRTLLFRVRAGEATFKVVPTTTSGGGMDAAIYQKIEGCDALFSLTPHEGEQYQADYVGGFAKKCGIKLYRLSQTNGVVGKTEIPVALHADASPTFSVCGPEGRRHIL